MHPLHERLERKLGGSRRAAAALTTLLVVILIVINFPTGKDDEVVPVATEDEANAFYEAAYAEPAEGGDSVYVEFGQSAAHQTNIRPMLEQFIEQFKLQDARTLEVGAGSGTLQDVVEDYTGLDIAANAARMSGLVEEFEANGVVCTGLLDDETDTPGDYAGMLARLPEKLRRFLLDERPFEFRPVRPMSYTRPQKLPPVKQVWIKAVDRLPDSLSLHQNLLAYVSDYELLGTSVLPHGLSFGHGNVQMASLDHALWFHRELRVDEWLLYAFDSPNASGARGFARGQFFTRDGRLVASAAQEGLVRVLPEGASGLKRTDPRLQA